MKKIKLLTMAKPEQKIALIRTTFHFRYVKRNKALFHTYKKAQEAAKFLGIRSREEYFNNFNKSF